jgi:hypothetical protein
MGHDLAEPCVVSCKPQLLLKPLDGAWRHGFRRTQLGMLVMKCDTRPDRAQDRESVSLDGQEWSFGTTMQVPAVRRWLVACRLVVPERYRMAVGMG